MRQLGKLLRPQNHLKYVALSVFYYRKSTNYNDIRQQRVGSLSHAVTERDVGKWRQCLPLAFVLQEDILSTG